MQSSGNLGPGDMLGLLSSESYATAVRGTCVSNIRSVCSLRSTADFEFTQYGFSAAIGKTGAAIGTEVFTPIQDNLGKKWTFIIAAICGVVGVLVTWMFVKDVPGGDLANEDEQFQAYLVSRGWKGEMGEDDLQAIADKGIPPAVAEEVH